MRDKTISNAEKALKQLETFLQSKQPTDIEVAGIIQAFEFTFEQIWKIFKEFAETQGFSPRSPKQAFQDAYQMGIITDETLWLRLLQDRNLTVHTYNRDLAREIYQRIMTGYAPAIRSALERVKAGSADKLSNPNPK